MVDAPSTSFGPLLGRIFWMMIGPMALVGTGIYIVTSGTGWLTFADLAYFAILGLMFVGRYLEFRGGKPMTSDGEPATPRHFRRYVVTASIVVVSGWVAANFVGNHLLAQ